MPILNTHSRPALVIYSIQKHERIEEWLTTWLIKVNGSKCAQATFTLIKDTCSSIFVNEDSPNETT